MFDYSADPVVHLFLPTKELHDLTIWVLKKIIFSSSRDRFTPTDTPQCEFYLGNCDDHCKAMVLNPGQTYHQSGSWSIYEENIIR